MRWHEAALERHAGELAGLQEAQQQLEARLAGGGGAAAAPAAEPAAEPAAAEAAASPPDGDLLGLGDGGGLLTPSPEHPLMPWAPPAELDSPWGGSGEAHPPVTGRAVMGLQRGTASELEEVAAKAADEAEWGAVLQAVHSGLLTGRRLIWDEAARRIGVLLSSPAAFEGEHFLQVGAGRA